MILNKINKKKSLYYYILKYFYSWYILPMVFLHELSHVIIALIFNFKIDNIKIYKMKGDFPLWNGVVQFKYKKYNWKWILVLYAPIILFIPISIMWLNSFLFYISLYMISTIIIYNKKIYCLMLPSLGDKKYKRKIEYYTYIINNVGRKRFEHYNKIKNLNTLIKTRNLLNEKEFFIEKSNKNKNKNKKK